MTVARCAAHKLLVLFGYLSCLLSLLPAVALAGPALVTSASGQVEVITAGKAAAASSPPFAVQGDQVLRLAEGASVLILNQGSAQQLKGPAEVKVSSLASAGAAKGSAQSALSSLLQKDASTARVGGTRGVADKYLLRPVESSPLLKLRSIQWPATGTSTMVAVLEMMTNDEVVWSGTGDGEVSYDGEPLPPGEYAVYVEGKYHPFTVASAAEQAASVEALAEVSHYAAALEKSGFSDQAALLSLPVAVYLQAGMPTEALYLVDAALKKQPGDPGLLELRSAIENKVGIQRR